MLVKWLFAIHVFIYLEHININNNNDDDDDDHNDDDNNTGFYYCLVNGADNLILVVSNENLK